MFTRRHFELIARVLADHRDHIIRDYREPIEEAAALDAVAAMGRRFADTLALTNPNFDRDRFLEAAGVR
jgi:hypothetical protein